MHECSPGESTCQSCIHANALGVYQLCWVGMLREYITGELLTRAALMHHDDKGHDALKQYPALKWLNHLGLMYI